MSFINVYVIAHLMVITFDITYHHIIWYPNIYLFKFNIYIYIKINKRNRIVPKSHWIIIASQLIVTTSHFMIITIKI